MYTALISMPSPSISKEGSSMQCLANASTNVYVVKYPNYRYFGNFGTCVNEPHQPFLSPLGSLGMSKPHSTNIKGYTNLRV